MKMPERRPRSTPPRRPRPSTPRARTASRRPSPVPVFAAAGLLFAGTFGFLGFNMADGHDPALGPGRKAVAQVQPHRILVRKVIITRHVTVIKPAATAAASSGSGSGSGTSAASTYTPPAQSYTPAPTYTPAPAYTPPPAPVQTATS
jgi:hypothetical protein